MKVSNIKDGKRVAVTHGELFLLPVDKIPKGNTSKHDMFILAHSESGHHHVLQSKTKFSVTEVGDAVERYILLDEVAELVNQKTFDIHETRMLAPGAYKVYAKKEYDVRSQTMRKVFD